MEGAQAVMAHSFRFIATMPQLTADVAKWRERVRRIEDLGFSTVAVSDHLTGGWAMEPLTAMLAATEATDRLRVLSLVLANDFRHPVVLHKTAATIDVLSHGRVEIGVGAGWMAADYTAAGLAFDSAGTRLKRLEESVQIVKGLFEQQPLNFDGSHYKITDLNGLPKPIQKPRPPIMIGGGGQRVLGLAAREADIVGVHCSLAGGALDSDSVADLSEARVLEKVSWVKAAAAAAGRAMDDIQLQFSTYYCRVTNKHTDAPAPTSSIGRLLSSSAELLADSPAVLVGDLPQCVDLLQERRERYGFSYINLGNDVDNVAPLVAQLVGA